MRPRVTSQTNKNHSKPEFMRQSKWMWKIALFLPLNEHIVPLVPFNI